ncbi:SDR family NAD(P)-dependent oxidoreductase [Chitinophaga sancti]|uniref:SDR family NAD(P)-dependent oxidoreductase n=1 Tax=Chitinophaga sancti TaxID=1004 RepID=UPI002A75653B|nr:SDR family NAD(P)-dependent oxidoreductase [Chitinophaga sancti]WPQ61778.1 SDR family NAD(P)-dependent oxidoreductase [Chitinophaga sancti]
MSVVSICNQEKTSIGKQFTAFALEIFETVRQLLQNKGTDTQLVQLVVTLGSTRQLWGALSGLLKTAQQENPRIMWQLIELPSVADAALIAGKVAENAGSAERIVRYNGTTREVLRWEELAVTANDNKPWKPGGVYLITGGAGGLGQVFAREIVAYAKNAQVVLAGRSALDETRRQQVAELCVNGANVTYYQVDISNGEAVSEMLGTITKNYGGLNGIIHSAGVIRDNFLTRKTRAEVEMVLSPKVTGTVLLDEYSRNQPLDFFILFSSVAGALGNVGQGDYAMANAFMDSYAGYRNTLVAAGQANGKTISCNWPLWESGGMQVDTQTAKMMAESIGMHAMTTASGLRAFYDIVNSDKQQVLVMEGDLAKMRAGWQQQQKEPAVTTVRPVVTIAAQQDGMGERATNFFKKLLSSVLKLPANRINADAAFEEFGIDSVMVIQLTNELEKVFGSLSKTLLFEYQTIEALTEYFIAAYPDQLQALTGVKDKQVAIVAKEEMNVAPAQEVIKRKQRRLGDPIIYTAKEKETEETDIAIVGLAGRYPQAVDIAAFWNNLKTGKDCITEIPKDRWDHSLYYDADKNKPGKTYSKWGGFIEGVDQFDPLFFNISPREAEIMDPQERIFLECVMATLEDAGYTRETLAANRNNGLEGNVGVFVGVMYEEYQLYGAQETIQGRPLAIPGNPSSVANRVSYYCNFHGPSLAVDTMCSSSLTAIHLACQSIIRGDCEAAVAGGVNVSVHPNKYLMLGQGRFVSSIGRCESFGEGGDGYVPGEGVGAVLLKPLSKAIADGDHIYGVIKSSAVNHGGKTNGYSVPNPGAQSGVISHAFKKSGVDPRSISYIEAHGTGTFLGDPIEIAGLNKAFREFTSDKQFCAIGSAKSNIGHCESAAGIAGLTKILLQLKHRQLVPSLHSAVLNVNIDFANSPFVVQQELSPWERPLLEKNGRMEECPLRAGISSFGAGGSNAHLVIEEYRVTSSSPASTAGPYMLVLSARTGERLKAYAERLLHYFTSPAGESLQDIAYTLQTGREDMEERMGMLVHTREEATDKLQRYIAGEEDIEDLYTGQLKKDKESLWLLTDEDFHQGVVSWIRKGKYGKLLELWTKGYHLDWHLLYPSGTVKKVSLPTYPFARERYWIPEQSPLEVAPVHTLLGGVVLHPLLHTNTSTFFEQRFTSRYTGTEFFLKDHQVHGVRILPGVAYLEMARVAVTEAMGAAVEAGSSCCLKNVVWIQPYAFNSDSLLHVSLLPGDDGEIAFEIYSEAAEGTRMVHSQGTAVWRQTMSPATIDLPSISAGCTKILSSAACYEMFREIGLAYGPGHQGIQDLYKGSDTVLARLELPVGDAGFVLHPGMMDAGFQAAIGMALGAGGESPAGMGAMLPFALDQLEVYKSCVSSMWAFVRYSDNGQGSSRMGKLDITLCDETGSVCVKLNGFSTRALGNTGTGVLMMEPQWRQQALASVVPTVAKRLVILVDNEDAVARQVSVLLGNVRCQHLQSGETSIGKQFTAFALEIFETVRQLLQNKGTDTQLVQLVVTLGSTRQLWGALSGLLKTAQQENPRIMWQLIELPSVADAALIAGKVAENAGSAERIVRYNGTTREVLRWEELAVTANDNKPWKPGGVYLITGGAGGLGQVFAREIVAYAKNAQVVLAGRSALDETRRQQVAELCVNGANVTYYQVDISNGEAVSEMLGTITKNYGGLNGIIHSAGVIRDNFLTRKTRAEVEMVLSPKVTGTVLLDEYSRNQPLDFFILFSSVAGALGNVGQGDYAMANAFMDSYAGYRNTLVAAGQANGKTISCNWPLWESGGMQVDTQTAKMMAESIGMHAMTTASGLRAFYDIVNSDKQQVLVMEGDLAKMRAGWQQQQKEPAVTTVPPVVTIAAQQGGTKEYMESYVTNLLSTLLKLPVHRIDADATFEKFGIDSVMTIQLTGELEKVFGSLSKTLLFEYQTIGTVAEYFATHHPEKIQTLMGVNVPVVAAVIPVQPVMHAAKQVVAVGNRFKEAVVAERKVVKADHQDIAVIAVTGQYPQAADINAFWDNLKAGKDCITEVPKERWDHSEYYDPKRNQPGKTYSKWGGFIDGVDQFDPLFFNISPREAEMMDPQERLFMQNVWTLFESAGYSRSRIQQQFQSKVGVYVGAMYKQYHSFDGDNINDAALSLSSYNSIANRVSYYFDLQGPSVAIDTACSSSLIAIHMACDNLLKGECNLAVAGGVNLSIHPKKYLGLSQLQLIGSSNSSRSFSEGDGYLPAEAVGAVLLKPLQDAVQDGDTILGVIKSTMINHGGKSNGFSVPNPNAQAKLIADNFSKAGIDPRTISWVEAAANGAPIGDSIEMTALGKAFRQFTADNGFCPIGTVKSNIGHAEAASGISQFTKVLLQLQHKQLVPAIMTAPLNSLINFSNSPFYLQEKLEDWKRPVVRINGTEREYPRRATVSSFGAGGSNAHVILEEYTPEKESIQETHITGAPHLMVFSARTPDRLRAIISDMLNYLKVADNISMYDLAYTLQVGREAMECRMAVVVNSMEELLTVMEDYLQSSGEDSKSATPVYTGNVEDKSAEITRLFSGKTGELFCQLLLKEGNLEKLAVYWTQQQGKIAWDTLYAGRKAQFIGLPAYPFEKRRCWVAFNKTSKKVSLPAPAVTAPVTPVRESGPQESVGKTVANIIANMLGLSATELNIKKPLDQYGFDSIQLMELFQQLKSAVHPLLDLETLQNCVNTEDIIQVMPKVNGVAPQMAEENLADEPTVKTDWPQFPELFHLNNKFKGRPVFWLHAALGGVQSYKAIAETSERPFFGIQARGWMTKRSPLHGLEAMATYYIQIIQSVQPQGPYDLGGYSMGGILAYEITRQLQELGQKVNSVTMLDAIYRTDLKRGKVDKQTSILQAVNLSLLTKITQEPEKFTSVLIHRDEVDTELDDESFLKALIAIAEKRGLTRTEDQLKTLIAQNVKVQQAYEIDKYVVPELPDPAGVVCYYFRNKSGLFYGNLEPFYKIRATEFTLDHKNYWEEWEKQMPNLHIMDVDASNHMMMLSEQKVYETIFEFSRNLYSLSGLVSSFLSDFKSRTIAIHGIKNTDDNISEHINGKHVNV